MADNRIDKCPKASPHLTFNMKGEIMRVEGYSYGTDGTLLYRVVARPAPDNDDAMFLVAEENLRRI